ncbi:MAG: RNA polymerase subunit sigma [Planctomycetota bacterium]|nr:MAG: RNA polymerase subunit sigma [Planctomycetota bacterium]
MSVIRMGSTNTYSSGWDVVFGSGKVPKKSAATKLAAKANAKPVAKANAKAKVKAVPVKAAKKKASRAAKKKVVTKGRKPGKSRRG